MQSDASKTYLVTGGAGFIGSNFILHICKGNKTRIVNLDTLTYAGNIMNLASLRHNPYHIFIQGDINDSKLLHSIFQDYRPCALINFAAESHVDRSIIDPEAFITTNVLGTFRLLEESRLYRESLPPDEKQAFRFLHISTDEVFGSLNPEETPFHEKTPYSPNSPYSASKAASDHLVRAYYHTYGLPVLTTNCSNNYGPHQFPEKLIPLMILNARQGKPLPIYGDGRNVRDWLYVEDHCRALKLVLERGRTGEVYNIGGLCEKTNLEVVTTLCRLMDEMFPDSPHMPHSSLITFIKDRPGHDRRYAIDFSKIERELGWQPLETFESGLEKTIRWYLENPEWVATVQSGAYRDWLHRQYNL